MPDETTSANVPDMGALQSQLEAAQQQIERLKGTHSAVEKNRSELAAKVKELEAAVAERTSQFELKSGESATLAQQIQEFKTQLESTQTRATAAEKRLQRTLLAAGMVAEAPALATLIKTGALPAVEDDAQFEESLKEIVKSLKGSAGAEALKIVSGATPAVTAAPSGDYSAMELEAMKLMLNSATEAQGRKLLDQAMQARMRSMQK